MQHQTRTSNVGGSAALLRLPFVLLTIVTVLGHGTYAVGAQQPLPGRPDAVGSSSTEPTPATPGETHSPTTPRGAVEAYLAACRHGDYARAARYLDLTALPADQAEVQGRRRAFRLKVVLDRKLWIDVGRLSTRVHGDEEDELEDSTDLVGTLSTPRGPVDILLSKHPDDGTWRFAESTVSAIPELYEEFGYGALGDLLPEPMLTISFLKIELWQWVGLLLLVPLSLLVAWVLRWVILRLLRPLVRRTDTDLDDRLLEVTARPLGAGLALILLFIGSLLLKLSVPARAVMTNLARGLAVVVVAWLLLRVVDGFRERIKERLEAEERRSALALVPLLSRTVKFVLLALAFVALLQNLGFNVTGLVAGLGVGGIAIALAAQKTIENLFGGVMVVSDRPVRVGDFCRFGTQTGTVEEVGLRSTRVRTLDRTVISVPNAEFSQAQIENFATRDRIRLFCMLGLRYETSADQLRHVIAGLRSLLIAHPRVLEDPLRVRFVGFGAYSLDVEVFAYVDTREWSEFLAIREDILLRIMDIVAGSGSGFAFPSQTTYLGRDSGLDPERTHSAEQQVEQWRRSGKLPFPDHSDELRAELDDTLSYPPAGSAVPDCGQGS